MKKCKGCKAEKSADEFYRDPRSKDGLRGQCKICRQTKNLVWGRANAEKVRAYSRQSYAIHSEQRKEGSRNWQNNNPAQKKETAKQWASKNTQKVNARRSKRRAAELKRTPLWLTAEDFAEIEKFYERAKLLQQQTGIAHHVDHILPLQGKYVSGLHVPSNLEVIPATDNLKKQNFWKPE